MTAIFSDIHFPHVDCFVCVEKPSGTIASPAASAEVQGWYNLAASRKLRPVDDEYRSLSSWVQVVRRLRLQQPARSAQQA
jgi:hypothetical protein